MKGPHSILLPWQLAPHSHGVPSFVTFPTVSDDCARLRCQLQEPEEGWLRVLLPYYKCEAESGYFTFSLLLEMDGSLSYIPSDYFSPLYSGLVTQ